MLSPTCYDKCAQAVRFRRIWIFHWFPYKNENLFFVKICLVLDRKEIKSRPSWKLRCGRVCSVAMVNFEQENGYSVLHCSDTTSKSLFTVLCSILLLQDLSVYWYGQVHCFLWTIRMSPVTFTCVTWVFSPPFSLFLEAFSITVSEFSYPTTSRAIFWLILFAHLL